VEEEAQAEGETAEDVVNIYQQRIQRDGGSCELWGKAYL
jgi:hypothetical protein